MEKLAVVRTFSVLLFLAGILGAMGAKPMTFSPALGWRTRSPPVTTADKARAPSTKLQSSTPGGRPFWVPKIWGLMGKRDGLAQDAEMLNDESSYQPAEKSTGGSVKESDVARLLALVANAKIMQRKGCE